MAGHLHLARLPGPSWLAEAIRDALRRWSALTIDPFCGSILDDGRIDLDTNPVERAIQPVAFGRKNTVFAGGEGGARRWAIVASLGKTARLNGIEPSVWLRDSLTQMVDGHPVSRLGDLLPWSHSQATAESGDES